MSMELDHEECSTLSACEIAEKWMKRATIAEAKVVEQATTIARLTELALTHPDFPTSCIHEEEPWYCDSCMLFYQEEMQHWHEKRDAALTKQAQP